MTETEKIVIIGGTSGIGLAVAQRAINESKEVVIIGRDSERLDQAKSILGDSAEGYIADAGDSRALALTSLRRLDQPSMWSLQPPITVGLCH